MDPKTPPPPPCTGYDPEADAGAPTDDGWDEPETVPAEEVTDGELDSGPVPGQPA